VLVISLSSLTQGHATGTLADPVTKMTKPKAETHGGGVTLGTLIPGRALGFVVFRYGPSKL
jgi:hypothetical protein